MNDTQTFNRLAGRRNLYLISQEDIDEQSYGSAIVAAWTEDEARLIHPEGKIMDDNFFKSDFTLYLRNVWVHPDDVIVTLIGLAEPGIEGVIQTSFLE